MKKKTNSFSCLNNKIRKWLLDHSSFKQWVLNKEGEKGSEKITTEYYDPITTETTSTSQLFNIVSGDNHTPVAIKSALDTRQNLIAKDGPVPNSQIVSTDSDTPRYEWSIIELDH
ncbi:hypothetical protein RCL_jg3963.t1 [Rhizophagus clarus]|uniref:Uncharacterized protein n=1 Tax=Rhizophagus clarus TaxID=94130 RepID=A0A8H3KSW1_9GLOM|nr:hypothetical protein RCL_jg3963.t1 [Rhizophagus clarus]